MMQPSPGGYAAYDLHLHTFWSYDATADIEVYFRRAREMGMRCIAITEHHNMDSAEEAREVAERYPDVRLITAAELSVNTSIGAVDLVCYGLPRTPSGALARVLEEYRQWQQERGAAWSRGMQALGFDYTDARRMEVLRRYRPERVIRRQGITHVKGAAEVQAFIDFGYIRDAGEWPALRDRVRQVVKLPLYPPAERVAPAVKDAGGKVAIAHPPHYFQDADRARMDRLRGECGLDGIECAHRKIHPDLTAIYRQYCLEHGLFSTGGSDSHVNDDALQPAASGYTPLRRFGCHVGAPEWLDELLGALGDPA